MKSYIEFLKNTAYNVEGEITEIVEEDMNNIYYYDAMSRWCYMEKGLEGVVFERVYDHELKRK